MPDEAAAADARVADDAQADPAQAYQDLAAPLPAADAVAASAGLAPAEDAAVEGYMALAAGPAVDALAAGPESGEGGGGGDGYAQLAADARASAESAELPPDQLMATLESGRTEASAPEAGAQNAHDTVIVLPPDDSDPSGQGSGGL